MDNLWHLINPNFKKEVSLRVVKETLADLLYIAIDQRYTMVSDNENATPQQRDYLRECLNCKDTFIDIIVGELTNGEEGKMYVTKAEFDKVVNAYFARPHNLRLYMMFKLQNRKTEMANVNSNDNMVMREESMRPLEGVSEHQEEIKVE